MNSLFTDIRAALHSIWRRRWLALMVAWVVCAAGWAMVGLVPNTWESHSRLMVQLYDPLSAQVGIGEADRKRDIDRVRDTLTSAANLEKVVRGTRLGDDIADRKQMDGAIGGLAKSIKIVATQDNIFEVTAQARSGHMSDAESARLSRDIVQKVIEIFRDGSNSNNQGDMKQTLDFLDQQLVNRQGELQAAEQRRLTFETQHPELAQGGVSLIQQLEQNRAEMRGLDADIAAAQSSLAAINAQIAGTPATIAGQAIAGPMGGTRAQLAQVQADLAGMRARHDRQSSRCDRGAEPDRGPARPDPRRGARLGCDGQRPAQSGLYHAGIDRAERTANVQGLQARRTALQQNIAQQTSRQLDNPELVQEAQNISRDYDVLKAQYDKMLQDREELRLRGQVVTAHGGARIQVLDPPLVPRAATAPNRPLFLTVVLIAGIGAGLGAAFAAGEMQSGFATTAKLERVTGLTVLGAISQSVSDATKAERARKLRGFYAATAALGGLFLVLIAMQYFQHGPAA
jgi:uncharacterized protein involved in exopolysaccharide biosynthesis